jgi:hypothetical protein
MSPPYYEFCTAASHELFLGIFWSVDAHSSGEPNRPVGKRDMGWCCRKQDSLCLREVLPPKRLGRVVNDGWAPIS